MRCGILEINTISSWESTGGVSCSTCSTTTSEGNTSMIADRHSVGVNESAKEDAYCEMTHIDVRMVVRSCGEDGDGDKNDNGSPDVDIGGCVVGQPRRLERVMR